jgi:predicted Zn-dependent protease
MDNRKDPNTLDTLAAAYAEIGQFANAVSTEKDAIQLSSDGNQQKEYKSRLKFYEANVPYREGGTGLSETQEGD